MSFNTKKALGHILFWVAIFLFYIFSVTSFELFEQSIETTLFKLPLLIIAAYTFNYWQIPIYLKQKKYIAFGVSMIFVIAVLTLLFRLIGYYHLDKYCADGPYPLISLEDFPFHMLSFHFPALIMYFYKTNKEQELEKEKVFQLEKEKIATELKYLKAQLNPHFLFNTLNNLYSYVITKSPKAPDMILQLSEILDYILYKSQRISVPIIEEIHAIENYIALEQIKYEERLKVIFKKDIIDQQQKTTPLLLLSIIENAFKHGVRDNITKPEIRIVLEQFDSHIEFSVWNTKTDNQYNNKTDENKSGIGLANIQRQLDLIYPGKHNLEIDESNAFFNLKLTLKIN
ncbi:MULTISPECIES: sensor histidine kinase [Aquimarina]|uniref:GHKL domain-containing protein n=1 Tax=Aquimarina algiphila TaxID=2047982 RepID=A0A554VCP6_9FLAO|nr:MULTISPECIES: histidine kinase [Aquimarina]TSE04477.1 GHKL domain-containing protein [Aquimarina algiphila]